MRRVMMALSLLLAAPAAAAPDPPSSREDDAVDAEGIVVTGVRPKRPKNAEEPYSETKRVPLGSRIPRIPERRMFYSIASDTGLAGLIGGGKDNNFDALGGSMAKTRVRVVKECKADREEVSEKTACALIRVAGHIESSEFDAAKAELAKLDGIRMLPSFDRYYAANYHYRLAAALKDDAGREVALKTMLASGRMPEADRPGALRTLVAMALARGDDQSAIAELERLIASVPDDARSQANLAALYARHGRLPQARSHMALAVASTKARGDAVPQGWIDFLTEKR